MLRAQFMNIIETRDKLFNVVKVQKQETQAAGFEIINTVVCSIRINSSSRK